MEIQIEAPSTIQPHVVLSIFPHFGRPGHIYIALLKNRYLMKTVSAISWCESRRNLVRLLGILFFGGGGLCDIRFQHFRGGGEDKGMRVVGL